MVAKIVKGTSFSKALNYIIDSKKSAEIIASDGVSLDSIRSIADSFEAQTSMRPDISKPVYHISLSFHPKDKERLTNELMIDIMNDYLAMMKLYNTQFVAVRHYDKEHPHIHLCINRIDYNGKLISDQNNYRKNEAITKSLTKKYGLYFSDGRSMNYDRLREPALTKYHIRDAMSKILPDCRNWSDLKSALNSLNISMEFKYKGSTEKIDGVIFTYNNISLSGSKIDRNYSYSKLNALFEKSQYQQEGKEMINYIPIKTGTADLSDVELEIDAIDHLTEIILDEDEGNKQCQNCGGGVNNELPKKRRR